MTRQGNLQSPRQQLLAALPVKERRLELAGISTAVLEGGKGRPVVLLHGPMAYAAHWMGVIPGLTQDHTVIVPDLPGHGASEMGDGALDVPGVLAWLGALIERTCSAPPVLVGQLLGGAIALRFAIERGELLERLVLVDTFGLAPLEPAPEFGQAVMQFQAKPSASTHDSLWRYCAFDLDRLRERMGERWTPFAAYNLERARTPATQAAMKALIQTFGMAPIAPDELARIKVPTSLIWGRHDLATPLAVAEAASKRYRWPLHVIESANDDPPIEQPEAVLQALRMAIARGERVPGRMKRATTAAPVKASRASTVEETFEAALALVHTIGERAAEVEAARRVPRDLLDDLVATGCFRMLLPMSHGGLGADLASAMRVFETLAGADASVGWTVMIGASCWCDLVGLPRATFDALFAARPRVIMAGVFSPSGSISRDGDGYRVTGRWSFASGCQHADWLFGNCIEGIVDGRPQLRMAVFSPDQVAIEDTWTVSGLSGTGSHHFRADGVFVPSDRTLVPLVDQPCIDEVIARIPVPAILSLAIGSIAVGIAQGALDDIIALASEKTPLLAESRLAANAHFQFELARADTGLRAARALLYESAGSTWATIAGGSRLTLEQRARVRAAAVWATSLATEVVTIAYRAGGGGSVYAGSPLQRRLRDINAVTQHFLVRHDTLTTAGAILAGQDVRVIVF